MPTYLKQSTAFTFRIGPFVDSTDGVTAETGLTIAQADIQISKNGGAFAQTSASPTTTHDTDGWYQCPLTTTDTGTLGPLTVQVTMSGALPVWRDFMVVPANVYDSLVAGTDVLNADVTQIGGDTQSATDLKDFADAGYDPATNKVQGVVLVDTTTAVTNQVTADATAVNGNATAAANLESDYDGTGYVKTNSTIGTCTTNSDMRGTDSAALASVCTEARLAELDAGNIPTDLANILTDTAEIGAAGAGLTAIPWNSAWAAEVELGVNDALDTAISELTVATPTATPTLRTGLMLLYMMARNKIVVQTSGTDALEIYNDAGTKIASKLLTDDGSDYTEAEMT